MFAPMALEAVSAPAVTPYLIHYFESFWLFTDPLRDSDQELTNFILKNVNLFLFAEREYRCLGKWEEKGVTYTYTERRDVTGYECFAGVMMSDEVLIMEAGINCGRGLSPMTNGMKLLKQGIYPLGTF